MTAFDPRLTPARPDLAAAHLLGQVEAARFVEGRAMQVIETVVDLRKRPDLSLGVETQALFGETFVVYAQEEGWAWGQCARDGYVGYVSSGSLAPPGPAPTHRVDVLRTHLYPGPSIKTAPLTALTFDARLTVNGVDGPWAKTPHGFAQAAHLAPIETLREDAVAVAEMFLGLPYLWGGRSSQGLDCSGLAQTALRAAGHAAPRDSDMLAGFGAPLPVDADMRHLRRGDLVFWKGHVGLMRDADTLLHANGFHMLTVSEPLAQARGRILANGGGDVAAARRP
jgi:cell wall-associated NlpC family hydrolase